MTEEQDTSVFFDHFAEEKPTKFGLWLTAKISKKIFKYAQLKPGSRIIEVGPGRGIFSDICLQHEIEYWAIEPNDKMARLLEDKGVKVVRALVPPIPDLGQSFDAVVMNSVMEHMDTVTQALELTKQVYQLLNPQGQFIIASPDCLNLRHHFFHGDFSHNYVTTWRRLRSLMINAGFTEIRGTYHSGPFTGVVSFPISAIAVRMPFGILAAMFPKNRLCRKLYKLEQVFLRRAIVIGTKKQIEE